MENNNVKVLVEVLQSISPVSDSCNCSGCPSSTTCEPTIDFKKETDELALRLKEKYGNIIEIKYVDIDEVGLDEYPIMNKVLQMGYPFPITLINGDPRFAGGIMETEIDDSIQAILEEIN